MTIPEMYQNTPHAVKELCSKLHQAQITVLKIEDVTALSLDASFNDVEFKWNTKKGVFIWNIKTKKLITPQCNRYVKDIIYNIFYRWTNNYFHA